MAGERILVVEDEIIVQLHLCKLLERLGYRVAGAAASAAEAYARADAEPPDLALMDIRIEGDADGIEAAHELRRRHDCAIVFLTAYADGPTLERSRAVEPVGYLVKPFEESDLRATLETALAKDRAMRRLRERRDDLETILDTFDVGTAMIEEDGALSFLSASAARLLGVTCGTAGGPWTETLPLDREAAARVRELFRHPAEARGRVPVEVAVDGRTRHLEIGVGDDPRRTQRRILFFYDTTEVDDLRRLLREKAQFHDLVGRSPAMAAVFEEIRQVAGVDWPVVIEGETGSGKELVARAIHAASPRSDRPFVAVNCAGLTESLLASQLFGHRKGAFTGAVADHRGYFEMAHTGTLFLDEIGEVSAQVQTSLLRVLEERRVTPLGASESRPVDVRVVTATHRNLPTEVAEGRFRADLLYRIRVARVRLPPLRERGEDLELLATWFLDRCRAVTRRDVLRIGREALNLLRAHPWPGNVRELRSAIEYAVIRCRGTVIQPADLPPEIAPAEGGGAVPAGDARTRLLAAIERAGGNRAQAARLLGMSRATLYRRLEELKLSR